MGLIYILPGILGSELYTEHEPSGLLWVNYGRLVVGEIGRLRLDVDGLSPGPPDGLDCFAGAPLPAYYGFAQSSLFQQLKSRNYDVQPWGYDWRKDILSEGVELANNIRFRSRLGEPVTIVGHSQGGLVARAAWYELKRTS